jgi:hypothetical protein
MTREQIRAWVARTRAERGLPRHVEDDQVLTDLAQAIREPTSTDPRALAQVARLLEDDR